MNQSSFIALSSAVVVPSTVIADQTLLLIAIVVGFAGNSKVCCFFVKRQDLRKVPHFYLIIVPFQVLMITPSSNPALNPSKTKWSDISAPQMASCS